MLGSGLHFEPVACAGSIEARPLTGAFHDYTIRLASDRPPYAWLAGSLQMTTPGIFRILEITAAVLLTTLLFAATNADLAAAGWLRGDRAHAYRVVFAVSVWLVAAALFASPRMGIGRRTFLGALGGYVASAFAQFVVVPLIENRAIASPIYESVVRFGIAPMFLAPLATLGWAAGALVLLSASGADALRRRLLHQLE